MIRQLRSGENKMQRNQLNLDDRPLRQNKAFLRAVYNNQKIEDVIRWFDKVEGSSGQRQTDEKMTLDRYMRLMTPSFYAVLQTGSPIPDEIRCCSRGVDKQGVERFLWVIAPYTERNYVVVSTLFKKFYKEDLDKIPVLGSLQQYHRRMGWG